MPDALLRYVAMAKPPNLVDRFLANSMAICVDIATIVAGVALLIGWATPNVVASPALAYLPPLLHFFIALFLAIGGASNAYVHLHSFDSLNKLWYAQRISGLLPFAGWSSYATLAAWLHPEWVVPWTLAGGLATGYFLCFVKSILHEKRTRRMVAGHE